MNLSLEEQPLPEHVPEELVRDIDAIEMIAAGGIRTLANAVDLHNELPPVFWATRMSYLGPCWVVLRAVDLRQVLQDPETFSSSGQTSFSTLIGETWAMLPLEVDPPEHAAYRAVINPLFTPKKMMSLEPRVREIAAKLIQDVASEGSCDFNEAFAIQFPALMFLELMGWPQEEAPKFVGWAKSLIKTADMAQAAESASAIAGYLRTRIAEARSNPGNDFCSYAVAAEVNKRPMTDDEVLGMCFLVFIAGLDTVTSMLGFHFLHLATHPKDQQRLRENPALIPDAVEELLRAYAIVNGRRRVTKDIEIGGIQMKAGDFVMVSALLGNTDETAFPNPGVVDFDRQDKRHMTFNLGPHRCAGSNLARRELILAIEEWLKRVPSFSAVDQDKIAVRPSGVMGLDNVMLRW